MFNFMPPSDSYSQGNKMFREQTVAIKLHFKFLEKNSEFLEET